MHVRVPIAAVLAIYARETGQGLVFSDEDGAPTPGSPEPSPPQPSPPDSTPPEPGRRARLTVVK
jgi:stringent starvation protein B